MTAVVVLPLVAAGLFGFVLGLVVGIVLGVWASGTPEAQV